MDPLELSRHCLDLPVFPLPDVVLMPGALLPLHVFEPRYRLLVNDCLAELRPLAVCQIRPNEVRNAAGAPGLLDYAAVGVISAHRALPDGRAVILINPVSRIRLESEVPSPSLYRTFRATPLVDLPVAPGSLVPIGERIRALFSPMLGRSEELASQVGDLPPEQVPEALAGLILRTSAARQVWLAEDDPLRRAAMVEEALLTILGERRAGVGEA